MRPFSKGAAEPYIVSTLVVAVVAAGGFVPSFNLNATVQHRYGPGVCGPVDPFYVKTATMTGGQPFLLSPTEISKSGHIMSASSQSELMLWAGGEGTTRYVVPIDSSVKRTSFSATFDQTGGVLTVISPDGTTIQPGDKIQDSVLACGRVVTIDSPAVGPWQVTVAPSGRFWLRAQAKTELSIVSTEFVAPGGRPGHEGLFKIPGMPVAGRPAMLRVSFTSTPKRPVFQLASIDAQILEAISLEPESDDEFIGPVTLPDRPFRVVVSGVDDAGMPFQRMFPTLFTAEPIEVVPSTRVDTVVAGEIASVAFLVRNVGATAHLRFSATGAGAKLLPVEPATAELGSGSEIVVTVRVAASPDAAAGSDASVLLTAAADAPSESTNYARQPLTVRIGRVP